ncbi:MAG TPA: MFS transporter [Steroidobacteraceae bacterium]|nr:MFS transporter [Steroidobacteraceae bacterium]
MSAGVPAAQASSRPLLGFWQIWNMCFGFLGIQFAFGLQNANMSRIFTALGAQMDELAILWIAAPLTGLVVQPLVGYYSDRTWNWLGRRRPYFLAGAVLTSLALVLMPRSSALWAAAGLLWILDASINISMEPFRAFVGDNLAPAQRPKGYAMQSFFIGVGAVVASMLPWMFTHAGVSNEGAIPESVRLSFDVGAAVLAVAMLWTIVTTREYPPDQLHTFGDATSDAAAVRPGSARSARARGLLWLAAGALGVFLVWRFAIDKQVYLLAGMFAAWGLALLVYGGRPGPSLFSTVMRDIDDMPERMRQLVPVQFFAWLGLFAMWIFTTPGVTRTHFHASSVSDAGYNEGANWVGVLFGAYNGFAALAAIVIPLLVRRIGLARSHCVNLLLGAAGLASFVFIRDPDLLLVSMVGVGIAWASIVSLPYAMLADSVPSRKMGVYMGIFNFFIVIPQLIAAAALGAVVKGLLGAEPIYALMVGGVSFTIAALCSLRVR